MEYRHTCPDGTVKVYHHFAPIDHISQITHGNLICLVQHEDKLVAWLLADRISAMDNLKEYYKDVCGYNSISFAFTRIYEIVIHRSNYQE